MRVAYFIFSNEHGTGGHHHSLKAIADTVDKLQDVETYIVNLGVAPSPIIKNNQNYLFLKGNEFTFLFNICSLYSFCKKNRIDILHAFDINGYCYVRILSFLLKIPSIYTKCGGDNLKYNPRSVNAIATSQENFDYLDLHNRHENLYLFENRVSKFSQDSDEIRKVRSILVTDNEIVFLRITRISNYYKDSIIKSIKFVSKIENALLVFLGSIYDEALKNDIQKLANELKVKIHFLSEPKYTQDAKTFIGIGDFIFGTGRTAMEVMAAKKTLLGFASNSEYPVIVNDENFDEFRYFNFSERVSLSNHPALSSTIDYIRRKGGNDISLSLYEKFQFHYLVDSRRDDLINVYQKTVNEKSTCLFFNDFIKNLFYHFLRSSLIFQKLKS